MNENLVEQKIASVLLYKALKIENIELKVDTVPPSRANKLNLNKEKDGEVARIEAYGIKNPSLIRVEPAYYYLKTAVFCNDRIKKSFYKKEDLQGFKISSIRGVAHSDLVTENLPNVSYVSIAEQMYEMASLGRVDIAIDTRINGLLHLKKNPHHKLHLCGTLKKHLLFVFLNSNSKFLEPILSASLKKLTKSGQLEAWIREEEEKIDHLN